MRPIPDPGPGRSWRPTLSRRASRSRRRPNKPVASRAQRLLEADIRNALLLRRLQRQHVFGQEVELAVLILDEDPQAEAQSVVLLAQFRFGRERADRCPEILLSRERWQNLLQRREPP